MTNLNYFTYQLWILLTFLAAIISIMLIIAVLQQKIEPQNNGAVEKFKKAVAFAFFGVGCEVVSRFISLIAHVTSIPTSELIICSIGRLIEVIGLGGLLFYLLSIWPFNKK